MSSVTLANADEPVLARRHPGRWVAAAVAIVPTAFVVRLLATNENIDWSAVAAHLTRPAILAGVGETVWLTAASMAIAILLGTGLAVLRTVHNPVLAALSWGFTWFFAGTPVLVQIIFWYNLGLLLPKLVLGIPFGPTLYSVNTNDVVSGATAAILGLSLHYGAYMAEIVRAGLLSVEHGQHEAAAALGLSSRQALRKVVLPQAMRVIIPPTTVQGLSLLKASALVSVIGGGDLLTKAQQVYSQNFLVIELLIVATFWYLVLTSLATIGQSLIERRFALGVARTTTKGTSR